MALATMTFLSQCLHRPVPVTLLLPEDTAPQAVLYLLPGYSDGHDSFVRNTALERYCAGLPLAVVMPDGQNSFYTDAVRGLPWWTYVSRELPGKMVQWLRLDGCRQYAGGVSMGGYGAAKLALRQPGRFEGVFLLSPVADIGAIAEGGFDQAKDPFAPPSEDLRLADIFGDASPRGTREDLFALLADARPEALPFFRIYTGTEDFLYGDILRLARALGEKGAVCGLETTLGLHRWATWEPFLADMAARIGAQLA